jgi:hypothetical protein
LRAFKHEELKKALIIMFRNPPFIIVISKVKGIAAAPSASLFHISSLDRSAIIH